MIRTLLQRCRQLPRDDSGVVMLETVLVFPLQLLLMMLIIQIAHIYVAANVMQYAVLQGTRTVLVNFRGANEEEACRRGARTAWTIMSTLNNPGIGDNRIRVPGNHYRFPAMTAGGGETLTSAPQMTYVYGMSDVSGLYSGSTDASEMTIAFRTPALPGHPETIVAGQMGYWLELVVPVGGPFVYNALKAFGRPVRVNSATGQGQVLMRQNARLPKPWPH